MKKKIFRLITGAVAGCLLLCSTLTFAADQTAENGFVLTGVSTDTNRHYTKAQYVQIKNLQGAGGTLMAWRGDKVVAKISLASGDGPVDDISVKVADLKSGENLIPSDNVKTFFIDETLAYSANSTDPDLIFKGSVPEGNRERVPDILDQRSVASMQPNDVKSIWVEFSVPVEAVAGVYTARLEVTAKGMEKPLNFQYELQVYDAVMPTAEEYLFDIELWQYPYSVAEYYGVEPFSEKHLEILRPHIQKYKELGGHAVTASIVEEAWGGQTYSANQVHYPSMIKWTKKSDGTFSFDYKDFDAWVGLNKEMGIGDKIVCYSMIPWENKISYYDEATGTQLSQEVKAGTPEYESYWKPFLTQLVAHLDEKGWFDSAYIGIDERADMEKAFDLIDSVKNSQGKSLKIAAAMDTYNRSKQAVTDRVDDLSVGSMAAKEHLSSFKRFVNRRNKSENKYHTTVYTCVGHFPNSFALSAPGESYWTMMFGAAQGTTGYLRWAYDAWVSDPLADTTHSAFEAGDCFLVYPDSRNAETPVSKSSVRLEKMAQGVRDVNKLYKMMNEFPELKRDVKKLLKKNVNVKHDFETVNVGRSNAFWATDEVSEQLPKDMEKLKNGISSITEKYIAMRNGTYKADNTATILAVAGAAVAVFVATGVLVIKKKKA